MLIYALDQTEGSLDVETKAFYDPEKGNLNLVQGLYRGPSVESYSSIDLSPEQFAKIVMIAGGIQFQNFVQKYKME